MQPQPDVYRVRNVSFGDEDLVRRAKQVVDGGDSGVVLVNRRSDHVGSVLTSRPQRLLHVEVVA